MLRKIALAFFVVASLSVAPSAQAYQRFCTECQFYYTPGVGEPVRFNCVWVDRDAYRACNAWGNTCLAEIDCYYN
ncbi:MAG TPA: hypothetical protein VJL31_04735 [Gemmatimonadales bacterium]|nr:hypothetical protein [Gemmatimonadales bacterium]